MKPVAIRRLLMVNMTVYLVVLLAGFAGEPVRNFIAEQFALGPELARLVLRPWQVITYSSLHLNSEGFFFGLIHISFNLLWLVWIGQELEELYGARMLTWLWVIASVAGAIATVVFHALFPEAAAFARPVYGATAPVVGVAAATATLWPHKRIGLLFIGAIPLRTALLVFLALDVLFGLTGGTFFIAHLGGALAGYAYVRSTQGESFSRGRATRESGRRRPDARGDEAGILDTIERWLSSRREARPEKEDTVSSSDTVDVDQERVDRILDKISEGGYESLTEEEKRILYEASKH